MRAHRQVLLLIILLGTSPFILSATDVASLTVMRFSTHAEDRLEFLGESFSETLTTKLVGLQGIRVYERSQFGRLAGELELELHSGELFDPETMQNIGKVVSIDYMVLGSVNQAGDRVRVTVRLIQVRTSRAVLSRELSGRYPDDLFDLQDQVALAVVEALNLNLSSLEKERLTRKPTRNLNAYDMYNSSLVSTEAEERIGLLHRALEKDPQFLQARYLLAETLGDLGRTAESADQYRTILARDPGEARALYNLSLLLFDLGDLAGSELEMCRYAELRPQDPEAWYHLGLLHEFDPAGERLGPGADVEEACGHYERALACCPTHPEANQALGILSAMQAQAETDILRQKALLEKSVGHLAVYLEASPEAFNRDEIMDNMNLLEETIRQVEEYLKSQPEAQDGTR